MAYTSTDLASIEAAIIKFATGASVVQVSIGDKLIRYAESDLPTLIKLKSDIEMSLGSYPARTYARQGGRGR